MNKTKARRLTISSRTRLVGDILKTTGIVIFSVVWVYTFVEVFGQILTLFGAHFK